MNVEFGTIIDHHIEKGNHKLVQVFSQRIQQVNNEKAYDIMMNVLQKCHDTKMLKIFSWFLIQTNDSNLNIAVQFECRNTYESH